jgi:hypothetical protein
MVTGTLTMNGKPVPITNGRLRGEQIMFAAGGTTYTGRVNGNTIQGTQNGTAWTATKGQ